MIYFMKGKSITLCINTRVVMFMLLHLLDTCRACKLKSTVLIVITLFFHGNSALSSTDLSYLTAAERDWLHAHPVLRLAINSSQFPFDALVSENERDGVPAEYISMLSNKLGISINVQYVETSDQILELAKTKEIDMILTAENTHSLSHFFSFSSSLISLPWAVISHKDAPVYKPINDLHSQTIGMAANSSIVEYVKNLYPRLQVKLYDAPLEGLKALEAGKVDVFVENIAIAGQLIRRHELIQLTESVEAGLGSQIICMAIRSDWPELLGILNKVIKNRTNDELNKINQLWMYLGTESLTDQKNTIQWLWPVAIILLLILTLYFSGYLRLYQPWHSFDLKSYPIITVGVVSTLYVAIVVTIAWFGLKRHEQITLNNTKDLLETVRDATAESLHLFLDNKKSIIDYISQDDQLVVMVETLLALPVNKELIIANSVTSEIRKFHQIEQKILGDLGYFIINKDHISISSMRDENIGSKNLISLQRPKLLQRVFNGETVFIPPIYSDVPINAHTELNEEYNLDNQPTMFIASPIKNADGDIIAVLAIRLDHGKQFSHLLHSGQIGQSGETYVIDSKGLLLSESRFESQLVTLGLIPENSSSILSLKIMDPGGNLLLGFKPTEQELKFTTMAGSIIKGNTETNTRGYRDYRGVLVYGSWTWMSDLGIGLATEIDKDAALQAYSESKKITILIIGIVLITTFSMLYVILTMSSRINRMLRQSHDELESKVAQRTKEIHSKDEQFKEILESSPIGVMMIADNGAIQYANVGASKLIGYEPQQLLKQNAYAFYEDEQVRETLFKEVNENGFVHNTEVKLNRADGTIGWGLMSFISTQYKNDPVILTWFADITTRKAYENDLSDAKEIAERANQAKSEFLSSMSHELRTPLNAILGFGQLLEMDAQDEAEKRNIGEIVKAGNHLLMLINDILDLSAIESGKLNLSIESVLLRDVFDEALSLITPMAEKRSIQIITPTSCQECFVQSDYMRLKQILLNLLSNAVKYNQDGGSIKIICEAYPDKKLRISITDTGIGISESQLLQLFQSFNRLGAERSGTQGTGIGLVITKKLIEMMGGNIGVESQPGKGTMFWFELTQSENGKIKSVDEDETVEYTKVGSEDKSQKIILYIEDNPANLRLVTQIVEKHSSHGLISAPDGRSGIELAIAQQPDLILLDINLPHQDGYSVLKKLQKNDVTENIPVIAVTANAMKHDIEKGHKAGFVNYITKPIDFNRLIDVISQALD